MRPSLELLRSQMNACLTCRGQLYTPGSGSVLNEDTGKLESGPPTVHYDRRMLVYPQDRSSDVEAAPHSGTSPATSSPCRPARPSPSATG